MGRVAWIGVVQEVEDAVQHLLDGDARPPALALVEDAVQPQTTPTEEVSPKSTIRVYLVGVNIFDLLSYC